MIMAHMVMVNGWGKHPRMEMMVMMMHMGLETWSSMHDSGTDYLIDG